MKRLFAFLLATLALIVPAHAVNLLNVTITTPVTAVTGPQLQVRNVAGSAAPTSISVQANFVYGSGGLTVNWWLQTSLDGGTTWCDVFTQALTTSSSRQAANISSSTVTALAACTDGAGSGIAVYGNQWRVKYTTTGTYAGNTTLRVDVIGNGFTGQ